MYMYHIRLCNTNSDKINYYMNFLYLKKCRKDVKNGKKIVSTVKKKCWPLICCNQSCHINCYLPTK